MPRPTATPAPTDRIILGIALVVAFCILIPIGDGLAKLLGASLPLVVLLLARFAVQALLLLPLALRRGGIRPPPGLGWITLCRALLHLAGMALMFIALRYLPLADAVAISFVLPFLVLLLGWLLLGEEVGPHRLVACILGFVGVMMVIRPNFAQVGAPALLPLGVAGVFAAYMLLTRRMGQAMDPIALQALNGIQVTLLLIPVLLLLRPEMPQVPAVDWALLVFMGANGALAHLAMTWALRLAPTATLAPMQYLEIPFGTAVGWLMFRDLPDGLALAGICITVLAGLWIIARERAIAARQQEPAEPAPAATPAA
ncbi:DMT family transporter [Pseudoroseicyclus aestuarii]|uniref:EamA-like transporter family protein n=1 Tax=Pseudoroseicyclus aestuarii TaxID=1795041 RepID=A0A318T401_9RHOB|nr:DMT family transporter [Pseudoroseicyclus aestuarii]PYE81228.1 EamA-like transporter family protein [Pseudoroseicyclus aestuarii]